MEHVFLINASNMNKFMILLLIYYLEDQEKYVKIVDLVFILTQIIIVSHYLKIVY